MEFRILGPLEIADGERRLPLGGPKRRAVAALLLLNANRVVPAEQLIDGVWGDRPPAGALASLQNHVLRLRRELGDRIVTRAPGYVLRVEPGELDLDRFRHLVQEAAGTDPEQAASTLREALALWRGQPLADLAHEPVAAAAAGLEELRLDALERRVDADLARGRHAEVVSELEALVVEEPFRERLRAQLVLALYRAGRQADALDAYAAARATLVEELGTEPGLELQALQRAVLQHDPALESPAPSPDQARGPGMEESRKTVTILLADLRSDGRAADPEVRREQLRHVHDQAAAAIEAHGGTVGWTADDRVLGIFGAPIAREDDALQAIRAAMSLRAAGLTTRTAVVTGDVITGDRTRGRPLVSGAPLDEADRLRALAGTDDVLAGERTWRLVRHGVTGAPRDGAYAVTDVQSEVEAVVRRLESPLVGRQDELDDLVAAFERVRRDRRARLVTIFGSPGIGKTRLARELVDRLSASATCVVGRTPSYEDAPTYSPLRDAFSSLAEGTVGTWAASVLAGEPDGETVSVRIAAVAGEADVHGPVEETAWAVRRLLETLAQDRPLLLVLEDLHWASPAFLDLVQHIATLARGPILVLALARPELLDTRPDWTGGSLSATSILLDALPSEEARDLLDQLTASNPLAPEQRETILAAAGGNPLFLEQLLAAAADGVTAVPDSIQALLAARLDRLAEDERHVAQAAAACGQRFPTELLQSLVEVDVRPPLLALVRRDLVEADASDPLGRESWGFRHALVRDVAYGTLPKRRRAGLHERIATVVGERATERGVDASELIGYHLEAAYRAAREVDPGAPELGRLASDACRHLAEAGRHAYDERDMATAVALLGRALALEPGDARERLLLATRLADALAWTARRDEGIRVLDEAEQHLDPNDEWIQARLSIARHTIHLWGLEPEDPAEALADTRQAIAVLERAGDHQGLAVAHVLAYQASYRLLAEHDPVETLMQAVEHARLAGERALEGYAASWLCVVLRHGSLPVSEARRRIVEILEDPPNEYARASALGGLADLSAMEGAFDEARALVAENHRIIEELGLPQTAAADLIAVADVEIAAGDLEAAERILREALDRLERLDRFSEVNAAWRLALVLVRQHRDDEAALLVERARKAEGGDFVLLWRQVLGATLAARRGDEAEAERLLGEGVEMMDRILDGGMMVDLLLQQAEVWRLLGNVEEALVRLERAAEIAGRLGYVVGVEASAKQLSSLRGYETPTE